MVKLSNNEAFKINTIIFLSSTHTLFSVIYKNKNYQQSFYTPFHRYPANNRNPNPSHHNTRNFEVFRTLTKFAPGAVSDRSDTYRHPHQSASRGLPGPEVCAYDVPKPPLICQARLFQYPPDCIRGRPAPQYRYCPDIYDITPPD